MKQTKHCLCDSSCIVTQLIKHHLFASPCVIQRIASYHQHVLSWLHKLNLVIWGIHCIIIKKTQMSLIKFQVILHNSSMTDFWTVNHAVSEKLIDISWVFNATTVRVMSVLTLKRQLIHDTSHLQLWGPEVSLRSLLQTGSHGLTGS
jgi:hypothetical protein